MTQLKSLTFAALPRLSAADPVIHRRSKLIVRLQQQIALVQDPQFTLTRQKWIADETGLKQLRERLRDPASRICYARRKALVEPVFGVLKQQRGMRQFRRRSLSAVSVEWALATTAYNLTRLFQHRVSR